MFVNWLLNPIRTFVQIGALRSSKVYQPNKVMIWTDTFANNKQSNIFSTELGENNARLAELNRQDIRVIVGNPPYSVGQESQNDDNQNEHYDELDARLTETYVARTDSTLKGKLYDSYIRAYRWASDRIGQKGVIGFVTNAGWLETSSADGMRKCMAEEFNAIYIYHLRGNHVNITAEKARIEGGQIFGQGCRSAIAIVFLVKNPDSIEHGKIFFHAVDDYLTREDKLAALKKDRSIAYTPMNVIVPDAHGDWFNQRDDSYSRFMRMDGKKTEEKAIFKNFSLGVGTNRDVWAYASSKSSIEDKLRNCITFYNQEVEKKKQDSSYIFSKDLTKISWIHPQRIGFEKLIKSNLFDKNKIHPAVYRPYIRQYLYFDRFWNNRVYQMPSIFPMNTTDNLVICSSGVGSKEFSCFMSNRIVDLNMLEAGAQCFPRWFGMRVQRMDLIDRPC